MAYNNKQIETYINKAREQLQNTCFAYKKQKIDYFVIINMNYN